MNNDTYIYRCLALIAIAALLFIAIAPLPYGFYTFLRLAVCVVAIWQAFAFFGDDERPIMGAGFVGLAILFNPLIPVYLTKEIWVFIDAGAGVFCFISAARIFDARNKG